MVQRLDREQKDYYILQAQAINRRSKQPIEPESEFIIKVQDINDNAPVFINEPFVSSIPEMCPTGKFVTVVQHRSVCSWSWRGYKEYLKIKNFNN